MINLRYSLFFHITVTYVLVIVTSSKPTTLFSYIIQKYYDTLNVHNTNPTVDSKNTCNVHNLCKLL